MTEWPNLTDLEEGTGPPKPKDKWLGISVLLMILFALIAFALDADHTLIDLFWK